MRKFALGSLTIVPIGIVAALFYFAFIQGNPGIKLDKTQAGLLISGIYHNENAVQKGDLIVGIHGLTHYEMMGYALGLFEKKADTGMVIVRGEETLHLPFKTRPFTIMELFELMWPMVILISILLILGSTALYRAPPGPMPTLFYLMLISLSLSVCATIPSAIGMLIPAVFSTSFLLHPIFNWFSFGLWAHFCLKFPEHRDLIRQRWWIPAVIYLVPAVTTIAGSFYAAGLTPEFFGWVQRLRNLYMPLIIIGVFLKHCFDYTQCEDIHEKNQIKLPLIAYWLTFAPYTFFYLIPNLILDAPLISFRIVVFAFFILPLAYLAAILRYQLFNVDRILSRTMAYFTIFIALSIIYSLFLTILKRWFLGEQILSKELFLLFLIFVNILFHPLVLKLDNMIRRLFFRDQTISVKVMHDFSNQISGALHLPDLVRIVVKDLPRAIHLRATAIMTFEKQKSRLFPESLRFGKRPWIDSSLVRQFSNGQARYFSTLQSPEDPQLKNELHEIQKTGFSLVLPLMGSAAVSALLFLGPKKSGSLFNEKDIHLLVSFANQAGTALENAIQHESLAKSKQQLEEMFDKKVHAQKMAAIGEMTSMLAHELKNPLGIIHSCAQYLESQEHPRHITQEMLHYILSEAEHLNLSINSILKMARQKPPEFEEIDIEQQLHQLIDQWQRSQAHKPFVEIDRDIEKIPRVFCDFKQISQVVLNLIQNSEDLMDTEGKISISATHTEADIVVRIADNGPGIPEKNLDRVFKNFFTTKSEGLGLGLAASRQIIEAHNGSISLDNRPEGGAVAVFRLPIKPLATIRSPKLEPGFQPA